MEKGGRGETRASPGPPPLVPRTSVSLLCYSTATGAVPSAMCLSSLIFVLLSFWYRIEQDVLHQHIKIISFSMYIF
jgi:hypothetical protein